MTEYNKDYSNCLHYNKITPEHKATTAAIKASSKSGFSLMHSIAKVDLASESGDSETAATMHGRIAEIHDVLGKVKESDNAEILKKRKLNRIAADAHREAAEAHATLALSKKVAPSPDYRSTETIPEDFYS